MSNQTELRQEITNRIIESLKSGKVPQNQNIDRLALSSSPNDFQFFVIKNAPKAGVNSRLHARIANGFHSAGAEASATTLGRIDDVRTLGSCGGIGWTLSIASENSPLTIRASFHSAIPSRQTKSDG